jgi:hypothetical protein
VRIGVFLIRVVIQINFNASTVGYILILGQHSTMIDVVIMETAMAPMITGCILFLRFETQIKQHDDWFWNTFVLSYLSLLVFDIADFF